MYAFWKYFIPKHKLTSMLNVQTTCCIISYALLQLQAYLCVICHLHKATHHNLTITNTCYTSQPHNHKYCVMVIYMKSVLCMNQKTLPTSRDSYLRDVKRVFDNTFHPLLLFDNTFHTLLLFDSYFHTLLKLHGPIFQIQFYIPFEGSPHQRC